MNCCKLCGKKLHIYEQKNMRGKTELQAECKNKDCGLHEITRSLEDLRAMSETEIQTYVEAVERFNRLYRS